MRRNKIRITNLTIFHCIKWETDYIFTCQYSRYFLFPFSPPHVFARAHLNTWNRLSVTWLCPSVVTRRFEVVPFSVCSLVERIKVCLTLCFFAFLTVLTFESVNENLRCVKVQSSKFLCYNILCTTMEFEVSGQRMKKSYGVSTHIPTKYTKHCFLAAVHCKYWRNGYWININVIFAFILVCREDKDLRLVTDRIIHSK